MKLKKLIIKNFRGLKGDKNIVDFSQSDIIFLFGQNDVGKSSFLRAYEFFVGSSCKAAKEDFYNYNDSCPIEIEGEFLKEEDDERDNDLKGSGASADPKWIDKWVDEDNIIRVKKTWDTIGNSFKKSTFNPSEGKWIENGFGGFHTKFQKYTPTPIPIKAMENQESLEEKINQIMQADFIKKAQLDYADEYNEAVGAIKELQKKIIGCDAVKSMNEEINKSFQEVFSNLTLGIKAKSEDNIKIEDAFKKNHSVCVEKEGISREETFLQHGHGVIRQALFNFLSFLKKTGEGNRKEFLILFEEPELYLHPKIIFKLRKSLYQLVCNSPYQILCSSHSPLMIDISKPHTSLVRVVKDENEFTKTHQVGEDVFQENDDMKNFVRMINCFNPHVCESFYADKVLLVEGDTEEIVYRDLLSKFYPNDEIFVLNTGSKSNIPFFQEIFTHFEIEHYVIHDTDSKLTRNGKKNAMWSLNEKIWEKIEEANKKKEGLARRYVHIPNFEKSNLYKPSVKDGKPTSAYRFVQTLNNESEKNCIQWLNDIIGDKVIIHDQNFIENEYKSKDSE